MPVETVENRIGDFFELLSINKKFVLLPKGYWDLATNHLQDVVVEDMEEEVDESEINDEDSYNDVEETEEDDDVYYDEDDIDDDDTSDDLDDLVIMDEEELEN